MKLLLSIATASVSLMLLSGCSEDPGSGTIDRPSSSTDSSTPIDKDDLEGDVPVDPEGIVSVLTRSGPDADWTLTNVDCEDDPQFCQAALENEALQPVPEDAVCTEQYGGSGEAIVSGEVAKKPVEIYFYRTNGCEIARWEALSELTEKLSTPIMLEEGGVQ